MNKINFKTQVTIGIVISFLIILFAVVFFFISFDKSVRFNDEVMGLSEQKFNTINDLEINLGIVNNNKLLYASTQDPRMLDIIQSKQTIIKEDLVDLFKATAYYTPNRVMETTFKSEVEAFLDNRQLKKDAQTNEKELIHSIIQDYDQIQKHLTSTINSVVDSRAKFIDENNEHLKISRLVTYALVILGLAIMIFLFVRINQVFIVLRKTLKNEQQSYDQLKMLGNQIEDSNWVLQQLSQLDTVVRGDFTESQLAKQALSCICKSIHATVGTIYFKSSESDSYKLAGSYGTDIDQLPKFIDNKSGLPFEVISSQEQIYIPAVSNTQLHASSILVAQFNTDLYIVPFIYEHETVGIIEIGVQIDEKHADRIKEYLDKIGNTLATAVKVTQAHNQMSEMFEEMQQQTEELEAQQEELRTTNEELIHKTSLLEASEEELRVQQEELTQTNNELEEKAKLLEIKNNDLDKARQNISDKVKEVEQASHYKSEFMANMSHELRTPLNSILILAKLLKDNKHENLNTDQIKYASVIHSAGSDLLHLINELLDLAKIESGNVELSQDNIEIKTLVSNIEELFRTTAEEKEVNFSLIVDPSTPTSFLCDEYRLEQILKNLLSNAFKFTQNGGQISLQFKQVNSNLHFVVKDDGIGIAEEKQRLIFEAFKQEDGSTSRKFGGTGLGLSICRELANLLGGRISLESKPNEGSTFTFIVPYQPVSEKQTRTEFRTTNKESVTPSIIQSPLSSDIKNKSDRNRLLIIEDDINFAEILRDYAIEKGFEPLLAYNGVKGLDMALEHQPNAIILDIMLPLMDGWEVLKKLKSNEITRDIPVHMMSAASLNKNEPINKGAIGFLRKPVSEESLDNAFKTIKSLISTPLKRVLIIEDHALQSDFIKSSLNEGNTVVDQAFNAKEAMEILSMQKVYDCIILDINLPDRSGLELLDEIKAIPLYQNTPIIINTAMEIPAESTERILRHTQAMVLKSGKSNTRLIDEVNLFLNRLEDIKEQGKRPTNTKGEVILEKALAGKKVLIADDDMRNVFALSTAFEAYNMQIEVANNGLEAIQLLEKGNDFDLVLMDIMMPEMDGFEAIEKIRQNKKFANLPVIAVTAKAMKGDREKTIQIGANDYISKPIDLDKLISLMRVWLS
ncbi:response regulator [Sphingobacterium sp. SYP-B4668]|uniref:response regulator n=1 Tax=Sphingobacterium sp. SYP-B4668 TaxID=2996035 RepID=UPI0022DE95BD|nr:response regulator [Sphingobacterium sp. SYP-B4668]